MRFSESELELIKSTFAENLDLLKALRKFFLQIPVSQETLNFFKAKPLLDLIRKTFLPTITGEEPLNQAIDLWMTIQMGEKTVDEFVLHIQARDLVIKYLDQMLSILDGKNITPINFEKFLGIKSNEEIMYMNLIARNTIITHIEQQLTQLYLLAGLKKETPKETIERLKKSSNK